MNRDTSEPFPLNYNDILTAQDALSGIIRQTPLLEDPVINQLAKRRVLIKAEVLQRTGSFKFRGAYNAVSALDTTVSSNGVLAYSSGNHAQGVALAASLHGMPATIVMPEDAPRVKLSNTRFYGANVVTYNRIAGESREQIGSELARKNNLHLVKPYDDPHVIAGQGTCGLEILQQAKHYDVEVADVLVCCGGGGLSAGLAMAFHGAESPLRICPVEPEDADDTCRSLRLGRPVANESEPQTVCDAIVTPKPGELTFPILKRLAYDSYTVSDDQVFCAMKLAFDRLKLVVEPGGAVALAAAVFSKKNLSDPVICVLTGGNVDSALFLRALQSELPKQ